MKKLKLTTKWLIMVSALILLTGIAQAETISDNYDTTSLTTDWSDGSGGLDPFTLDLFDSNLGTLTQVDVLFESWMSNVITIDNDASAGNVRGEVDTEVYLTNWSIAGTVGNTTHGLNTNTGWQAVGADDAIDPNDPLGSGPDEYQSGTLTDDFAGAGGDSWTFTTDLAQWQGVGDITADLSTFTWTTFSRQGGGAGETLYDNNVRGKVTVTYTYTPNPIPEPATIALFGVGLIGVAGISRKKLIKT